MSLSKESSHGGGALALAAAAGAVLGATVVVIMGITRRPKEAKRTYPKVDENQVPAWLRYLFKSSQQRRVMLREWEDPEWRDEHGWRGNDLIHNPNCSAVRILCYFWSECDETLTGAVHFGPDAESHHGICHGGAVSSAFDDVLGHAAFCGGSGPWCGATARFSCTLKRPVRIGETMCITGRIKSREGRKVFITGELTNERGEVFAEMEGLSITGVKLTMDGDPGAVDGRTWITDEARFPREWRDSSWSSPAPPRAQFREVVSNMDWAE